MTRILEQGNSYSIHHDKDFTVHDELPQGTYSVRYNEMKDEYFLLKVEDFTLPDKIYGDTEKMSDRILNTFNCRDGSTGVHLDGMKGSGKTLLAKMLSVRGAEQGFPTIVINEPYFGETFNRFMQSIGNDTIVLFDEFEKVYDTDDQQFVLTLFDGTYTSKKMFIITTNENWHVSDFLKNRPGRMYYALKFSTLEENFVREYCDENLNNKDNIDSVVTYVGVFDVFNFDMLASAVEEMNRYDETLTEVIKYMNIEPTAGHFSSYEVAMHIGGHTKIMNSSYEPEEDVFDLNWYVSKHAIQNMIDEDANVNKIWQAHSWRDTIKFVGSDLISYDKETKMYTYSKTPDKGDMYLTMTKNTRTQFSPMSILGV